MDNFEAKSNISIDDLKYHDLREILSYLSVSQLFRCLTVCQKWNQIIIDLLDSQKVLSLQYNDINRFTQEEMDEKCDNWRHFALRSSVGRVIGKQAMVAVFTTPSFRKIGEKFFKLFDLCPNIQSLDLSGYRLQMSDIDIIFSHCPRLECLSVSSDETNWAKFLCPKISGLKHFNVSLNSKTPIGGVNESPFEDIEFENEIRLENLVIKRPEINAITLNILSSYLKIIVPNLKKFHFTPNHMNEFEAQNLISSLSSSNSVIKDLNINVFVFNNMFEALIKAVPNIECLYLHIDIESKENNSLKKLKNLQKLNLDFNSNVNIFSFGGLHSDSDQQYISFLPKIPATLRKLTLYDASLSISAFIQTLNYLTKLEELELIYVIIENDCQQNFWQVISNFKSLRYLSLNTTDIIDDGLENLINCESLEVLELVKYKGPNAAQTLIDTIKVIELFGQLASLHTNKWFDLRLDIDVFEVTKDVRQLVPRNLRIVNIGFKK